MRDIEVRWGPWGRQNDSVEGETNKQGWKAETGIAKCQKDRQTATMIGQVELENIWRAEWRIIMLAKPRQHDIWLRSRCGGLCVRTLSRSCGLADSRVWPLVTQWRARMPYWPNPISSSQSHTCSVLHLEKGVFKSLARWEERDRWLTAKIDSLMHYFLRYHVGIYSW